MRWKRWSRKGKTVLCHVGWPLDFQGLHREAKHGKTLMVYPLEICASIWEHWNPSEYPRLLGAGGHFQGVDRGAKRRKTQMVYPMEILGS